MSIAWCGGVRRTDVNAELIKALTAIKVDLSVMREYAESGEMERAESRYDQAATKIDRLIEDAGKVQVGG